MKKLLFLLWLPSAAFGSIMYVLPGTTADITYSSPSYAGELSWFSLWSDSLAASKTSVSTSTSQIAASLPEATLTSAGTWSGLVNNGASAAYDPPAAIAANPEPGTWGLLALGVVPGLLVLRRRVTR